MLRFSSQQGDAGRVPAAHFHAVDAVEHRVEVAEHRHRFRGRGAVGRLEQVAHLGDVGQDLRPQAPGDVPQAIDPRGHNIHVRRVQAAHQVVEPPALGLGMLGQVRGQAVDLPLQGLIPVEPAEGGAAFQGLDLPPQRFDAALAPEILRGAALGRNAAGQAAPAHALRQGVEVRQRDGGRRRPGGLEGHDPGDAAAQGRAPQGEQHEGPARDARQAAAEVDGTHPLAAQPGSGAAQQRQGGADELAGCRRTHDGLSNRRRPTGRSRAPGSR